MSDGHPPRRAVLATAALALAGCTGGSDDQDTTATTTGDDTGDETATENTETAEDATGGEADAVVGETVSDETLAMVVRDVRTTDELGEFQQADAGNTYLVVRLAVKNRGDEFVAFSGFLQTRVKDDTDHVYDRAVAVTESPFEGGQLAPGEVARGDLVYEVPADAGGFTLQFDFAAFDPFAFDRVTVDLESSADQAADVSQDLRVDVYSPGDTVEHESVAVTLHGVRTATELDQFTKADDGDEFVVPDVTVENGTDEPLTVSVALQMRVKDGRGRSYGVDVGGFSALDQAFAQGSDIAPGDARRGELAYQVPADAAPLYWTFEFSAFDLGNKAFWALSNG